MLGLEMIGRVLDRLSFEVSNEVTWVGVLLPLEVSADISFHFG